MSEINATYTIASRAVRQPVQVTPGTTVFQLAVQLGIQNSHYPRIPFLWKTVIQEGDHVVFA